MMLNPQFPIFDLGTFEPSINRLTAIKWAKQYYAEVAKHQSQPSQFFLKEQDIDVTEFDENRARVVAQLIDILDVLATMAQHKAEALLGQEFYQEQSQGQFRKGRSFSRDICYLYQQALEAFAQYEHPSRLSVLVGRDIIQFRQLYSEINPIILGAFNLQFNYMGRMLLEWMPIKQRTVFFRYFKALEDFLHAPLGEVHALAADYNPQSKELQAVQQLLSMTTTIAHRVHQRVSFLNRGYRSLTGTLRNPMVWYSSIRDIELFQIYLCWCVLQNSVNPIQQELFPMCVLLYPKLHVNWKLIREMLSHLSRELEQYLSPENWFIFEPYVTILNELFSDQVLG